jgi:hypothetical protein
MREKIIGLREKSRKGLHNLTILKYFVINMPPKIIERNSGLPSPNNFENAQFNEGFN